jgi:hypothetical protein
MGSGSRQIAGFYISSLLENLGKAQSCFPSVFLPPSTETVSNAFACEAQANSHGARGFFIPGQSERRNGILLSPTCSCSFCHSFCKPSHTSLPTSPSVPTYVQTELVLGLPAAPQMANILPSVTEAWAQVPACSGEAVLRTGRALHALGSTGAEWGSHWDLDCVMITDMLISRL